MNKQQKLAIENLRKENYSYAFIASKLDLNANTVKSYCRRHNITTTCPKRKKKTDKETLQICLYCGKPIKNDWNRCNKRFCSSKCRTAYWNKQKAQKHQPTPVILPAEPPEKPSLEEAPKKAGLQPPGELSSVLGRR